MICMNNKIKRFLLSGLVASLLLMVLSCGNMVQKELSDKSSEVDNADSKTYLSINLGVKNNARTILPDTIPESINENFHNFILKGSSQYVEEKELAAWEEATDIPQRIEVLPGDWTFTLSAVYDGAYGEIPYSATVSATIKRGIDNSVSFVLKPQGEFGGFVLRLDLSSNTGVDKVIASLKKLSGQEIDSRTWDSEALTNVGREITYYYSGNDENPSAVDPNDPGTQNVIRVGTYLVTFEFFTDKDPTPINSWENYIYISPMTLTQKLDVSLNFNEVRTLTLKDADGSDITTDDISSGIIIKKFSTRSNFDLPVCSKDDKIFLGWKDSNSENIYTRITPNITNNLTLTAYFVDPILYVSETGDDTDLGFTSTTPLSTFTKAFEKMLTYGSPSGDILDWTIKITGTIKGGSNNSYAQCLIPESINGKVKSLLLEGATGLDSQSLPQDRIDRGLQAINGAPSSGSAVKIETTVPVTITNLEITRGFHTYGAGINIAQGATVMLGNGVRIIGNTTGSGNGRGGGVHNEGTLFMYGTAVIGNNKATQTAVGSSMNSYMYNYTNPSSGQRNGNYSDCGSGIYNGSGNTNNTVEAKVYLGYSGFGSDGVTPVESTLTGGIYANGAGSGGGIYNQHNCTVYYKSGNIKFNASSGTGGGIDNYGVVEMCGENAKLINNSGSSGGGIYNNSNGRFLMSDGQINANTAANGGGGIGNISECYLYGKAIIGDKNASTVATVTSYGNKARNGGGIYNNNGNIYIGYKPDGSIDTNYTTNGGIYYNYAEAASGSDASGGGAIYQSGSNNKGIIYMAAGTIAYNFAEKEGGAVYVSSSKYFGLSGGTIKNNYAVKGGGAFSLGSVSNEFGISGNPSIPKGDGTNDIYLKGANIQIDGALGTGFTAYLTFKPYERTSPVLILKNDADTTLAAEFQKFEIAPFTVTDANNNQHTPHFILTDSLTWNSKTGSFLIEGDTWEADLARYISTMPATGGTVHVAGPLSWNLPTILNNALAEKSEGFLLELDLGKASGWSDSMPTFEGCTKLKSIVLPYSLSSMRKDFYNNGNIFKDCTDLESITISIGLKTIYSNFDGCTKLTDVYYMGSQTQKENISFPTMGSGASAVQETTLLSSQVTWHYASYGINISIDIGEDSDVGVSVFANGTAVTDVSSITKGTPLTFTVTSSGYSTYNWKVDGVETSSDPSLIIDTTNWVAGETYTVSLIASDSTGQNEDSYFAQITVTE